MRAPINRVTNANVYLNGTVNLIGQCEEVDLPQLKSVMVEHKGLGLWAKAKLPAGLDHMVAKFKWSSFYPDVLGATFLPMQTTSFMVRADVQQYGPQGLVAEVPLVALITGVFDEMPSGKIVKQENADVSSSMAVYYYKLMIAGADQIEVDIFANIYNVNDIDQLAQFRANIGG